MQTEPDPSAIIVPLGRHKGATVAELLARDPGYVEWLQAQGWLAQRFAEIHKALATRGARTDDTPEHNALQARFLDKGFQHAATRRIFGPENMEKVRSDRALHYRSLGRVDGGGSQHALATDVRFEVNGVDVALTWDFPPDGDVKKANFWDPLYKWNGEQSGFFDRTFCIELKPEVGDDFPSIMRQCQRLKATVLVAYDYNGRGATEAQMRAMFQASGIQVVFAREIAAEMEGAAGHG